jgi:WD40 repeat protein
MAEKSEKNSPSTVVSGDEFFNVGAPLHAVRPGYVRRPADDLLYETVITGHYAHVIAPDRTGKSSLISATSARLQNNGLKVAVLDLAQIGERDGGTDAGRWYYSIAYRLLRQLRIKVDLQTWWQDKAFLSHRQRLVEFYVEIVLQNISGQIVVFVDEIQHIAGLPFDEHLLASIRAAHNARTTEPEFTRLIFVLIGECDALSLVTDPFLSPFPIAQEIHLSDFSRQDLGTFSAELNLSLPDAELALDRVFYWTGGQPYLSQKLARAIARERISGDISAQVDRLAMQQLAGRAALTSEPHLSHIHRAATADRKILEPLLTLYGQIRKGLKIVYDSESALHRHIRALGLVVVDDDNNLKVRNRIYETVFTARWANENLPMNWRGPAIAALFLITLTAIPFAYTQLLPKPYMRVMANATVELATVSDAYVNLRSFPGHAESADRMYRSVLETRAAEATDRNTIQDIVRYAATLPAEAQFAGNLRAEFWDRQVISALRDERRDDALLASAEALVVPTEARRRRAATLVGDDYPFLAATVPAQQADGVVLDRDTLLLSYYKGAEVSQWSTGDQGLQVREPWTISALEVSPLVRRVIVDRDGVASRVGLTINVSHARLDDVRAKLIAPSGRTAEFVFEQASSAANEQIRIDRAVLSALVGEALNGTWSLSLRDEATGVIGHLVSWNLSLNSQVVVESFERGLDIPDPLERPSENIWFSDDGRYAIARGLQSDSARLWDLRFSQAARTIAVPASERVLGLSANAEFLVTVTSDTVNLWRTADGRRHAALAVGAAAADAVMSDDGLHLLVLNRGDLNTEFALWSLASGEIVAELDIAGPPAQVSIDAAANHLAVADYDRAVRVWNLRNGELLAQLDLLSQPNAIILSANGESLAAIHGEQGVSLWSISRPEYPVLRQWGRNEWHAAFSRSGAKFLAGNHREGFQAYRSTDGRPSGPLLDAGISAGPNELLAFTTNEEFVITAAADGIARFWEMPSITANDASIEEANSLVADVDHQIWRESGDLTSALAPGGERIAIGDNSGHVHIQQVATGSGEIEADGEDISFLGHRSAVAGMVFSIDGSLVASAGADGSVRIWDSVSGLPRPYYGGPSASTIDRMAFSPSGQQIVMASGQRVWIMNTESGDLEADFELGDLATALVFAQDNQVYLGSESGALQSMYADRTGNWHVRNIWQGAYAVRALAVSTQRQLLVVVDEQNRARLLNPSDGGVGIATLDLPDSVSDIAFSPSESRVVFKTSRWIHRALVSPGGLIWTDAVRAPKALAGSRMVFDSAIGNAATDTHISDPTGDRILVLTRDTGYAEITELRFSYSAGPTLFGNRTGIVAEWAEKLNGPAISGFVREGF